jgi:hypothetical protein
VVGKRLLVESFIVMEPYWTVRTGSAPFWMVFNKLPSAEALSAYLDRWDAFDEIYMMLFSHGVESIGLASIEKWRTLLDRARKRWSFVGVDEKAYPRDFAVFVRYYFDLKRKIRSRYPMPPPLALSCLDEFVKEEGGGSDGDPSDIYQARTGRAKPVRFSFQMTSLSIPRSRLR